MLCVNERLDLIEKYAPIKNEIIEAYAHCKFDRLSELLAEYDETGMIIGGCYLDFVAISFSVTFVPTIVA